MREDHFYLINLKEEERSPESKVPYGPPSFNPISFEAALELAQKTKQQYPIAHSWDLGSCWMFSYDTGDPPLPGIRSCLIYKNTSQKESYFPHEYKGVRPSNDNKIF